MIKVAKYTTGYINIPILWYYAGRTKLLSAHILKTAHCLRTRVFYHHGSSLRPQSHLSNIQSEPMQQPLGREVPEALRLRVDADPRLQHEPHRLVNALCRDRRAGGGGGRSV